MRDEHARRRPTFRPGLDLRLADGQVWSLPLPGPAGEGETAAERGGSGATWDDPRYRAIVRAGLEAEDEGDQFRAEMSLAIHLLHWNYNLDADDFEDLLDDHGEIRRRNDLSHAFHALGLAHFSPFALPARGTPGRASNPSRGDFLRFLRAIGREASRILGRRGPREVEGSVDLTT
jgi:hypothetical protein